jgi:D-alanyl-D-alanine carboxypeptidase
MSIAASDRTRIRRMLAELGIAAALPKQRRLVAFPEAKTLVHAGLGTDGRDKFLIAPAARAWRAMQRRARRNAVQLDLVSAFRSYEFQLALIRGKLAKGRTLEDVLGVNAPPGYSEHHTGKAIDVGTPGCPPLEEAFENTDAFRWLARHAQRFGFTLSYPRDNPQGYVYEPWHWRYR